MSYSFHCFTYIPYLILLIFLQSLFSFSLKSQHKHSQTQPDTAHTLAVFLILDHVGVLFLTFILAAYLNLFKTNRNSTSSFFSSPPDTYWGQFDEVSKYNVHLNLLERLWAAWYAYLQNDVLATGIMSFAMHEIVYFGRSIPWAIIDRIPYFNKYKIQNVCYFILRFQPQPLDH